MGYHDESREAARAVRLMALVSCVLSSLSVALVTLAVTRMADGPAAGAAGVVVPPSAFDGRQRTQSDLDAKVKLGAAHVGPQVRVRSSGEASGVATADNVLGQPLAKWAREAAKANTPTGDDAAPSPAAGWYRLLLKVAVRAGRGFDSKLLAGIPAGHSVYVSQVSGIRAHITKPLDGWVSLRSKSGFDLLQRITSPPKSPALRAAEKKLEALSDNLTSSLDSMIGRLQSGPSGMQGSDPTTHQEEKAPGLLEAALGLKTREDHELFPEPLSLSDHERLHGVMVPVRSDGVDFTAAHSVLADALREINEDLEATHYKRQGDAVQKESRAKTARSLRGAL